MDRAGKWLPPSKDDISSKKSAKSSKSTVEQAPYGHAVQYTFAGRQRASEQGEPSSALMAPGMSPLKRRSPRQCAPKPAKVVKRPPATLGLHAPDSATVGEFHGGLLGAGGEPKQSASS